ncbi:MAG: PEP-CTERM sorting domain-containing protein [Verrucomicrobiales bacterium]|nr:PEP-CTERM sorting domain-containing protein [Verrucomicrobiae bacterium]
MKTKRVNLIAPLAGLLATCALISAASAQTVYGIDSGVTSLTLHKAALDTLGFTIVGTSDTTTASVGYDTGLSISTTTAAAEKFTFTADPDFTPGPGLIEHTGTLLLGTALAPAGAVTLGNFDISFDSERMTAANSGFFLTDGADFDSQILFDIGTPVSNVFNGSEWHFVDSNLFVSPEFATFLGNPALTGQDFGDLRIDALTSITKKGGGDKVPEPSTVLLACFGGFALFFRRRR